VLTIFLLFYFFVYASYILKKYSDFWYNENMTDKCYHIYQNTGYEVCPKCGRDTHETDWSKQLKLRKKWLKDNPLAYKEVGWWSI
jgi:hypothetical protein